MAYDKVVDSSVLDAKLLNIANAIRSGTGQTEAIPHGEMPFAISEIDTGHHGKLPSYWYSAVHTAVDTIKALRAADSNNIPLFAWFSDCHNNYKYSPNSGYTGILSAAVMEAADIPFAVCTGDVAASSGNGFSSAAEMVDCFAITNNLVSPIGWQRLLMTQGNHDGSWGTANGKAYAYQMSPEDLYKYIYRKFSVASNHVFGGGDNSYYYVNYDDAKIRVIMLNSLWCETSDNEDGTAVYDRQHYFGYGQAQLQWLAETALSFDESGWTVVIATHVPPNANYQQYIRDYDILVGILSAYCDLSAYTGSYTYNSARNEGQWANVSVSVDFSSAVVGKLAGVFCGHCHKDSIDTTTYPYPLVTITSDADLSYDDSEAERVTGTDNEHAIDFVTINPVTQAVTLTRLGVGSSRAYSYKGITLYAVSNNLTNVTTSNGTGSVEGDTAYTATLTANDGYENLTVTVTMGGEDITSTAYSDGVVGIANVTGDIVITASASKAATYTNLADPTSADWANDSRLNSSGSVVTYTGACVTNWIDVKEGDVVRVYGLNIQHSSAGYLQPHVSAEYNGTAFEAGCVKCSSFADHFTTENDVIALTMYTIAESVSPYVDKIRFSGLLTADSPEGIIITVNEEIAL